MILKIRISLSSVLFMLLFFSGFAAGERLCDHFLISPAMHAPLSLSLSLLLQVCHLSRKSATPGHALPQRFSQ